MNSSCKTIRGAVNVTLLEKADRLFRNDDDGIWIELLQNARRAGASSVEITIEEICANSGPCLITVVDNGRGIDDFQSLLTLGTSRWDGDTQLKEDPAGMGFFSLCRSKVEVQSGDRCVRISPEVFLGKGEAEIETSMEVVRGTRLRFRRESSRTALIAALERVTEFFPLEVRLDGQILPCHDFLDGALYRELIDGIEVGFANAFEWKWNYYNDGNWNFYGARIHSPFVGITGLLGGAKDESPLTIHARFNVLETAHVKLQLPDRRAIIQDDFLKHFIDKARAAAYRFFQMQPRHALPFKNWREAKQLGVELPEAACLLSSWHAIPQDENVDPLFGYPAQHLLPDASGVLLVDRYVPDAHTLDASLQCGATLDGVLYGEKTEYEGYAWYDRLPRITNTDVFVDDVPCDDWTGTAERPAKIEVEVTIAQSGNAERRVRLPALIHAPSTDVNQIEFVALRNSPWDNDDLAGPFSVTDFLIGATFCAGDDVECDSWNTQMEYYSGEVEREVNSYFRGPKATLLALLRKTIDIDATRLAAELGVQEIRFKRTTSDRTSWAIEMA